MSLPHIWLTGTGVIHTAPERMPKQTPNYDGIVSALKRVHGYTAIQLTTISADREAMLFLCKSNLVHCQRQAKDAMIAALEESETIDPPIMIPTKYEKIAWLDEFSTVKCKQDVCINALTKKLYYDSIEYVGGVYDDPTEMPDDWQGIQHPRSYKCDFKRTRYSARQNLHRDSIKSVPTWAIIAFTEGNDYEARIYRVGFQEPFVRFKSELKTTKDSYGDKTVELDLVEHEMILHGKDQQYSIYDDSETKVMFGAHPYDGVSPSYGSENRQGVNEMDMWNIFHEPKVPTVAEIYKEEYESNMARLKTIETLQGFKYFPPQMDYIARMACLRSGLISAATGCGKSLIAISLIMLHNVDRCLIIAPKGTVQAGKQKDARSKREAEEAMCAQWAAELKKFGCPKDVYLIRSYDQCQTLMDGNDGELPKGVYLTWPQAFLESGGKGSALFKKCSSFESLPASWARSSIESETQKRFGYKIPEDDEDEIDPSELGPDHLCAGIGRAFNGVRCIGNPSMATEIGANTFDMMIVDEAHFMQNINSQRTRSMLRMEPAYRYGMTATPIPNAIENLFAICGWVANPKWHMGNVQTKRWPYSVDDIGSFREEFCTYEEDLTEAEKKARAGKNAPARKINPLASQPCKLLKLIKPMLSYLGKEVCNPDIVECKTNVVRVPMGRQQFEAYAQMIDPSTLLRFYRDIKTMRGVQTMTLRGLCASPTAGLNRYRERMSSMGLEPEFDVTSDFNPKQQATLNKIYDCLAKGEQVVHVSSRKEHNSFYENMLKECGVEIARIDSTRANHTDEANKFKSGKARVLLMGIKCAQAHSFEMCPNLIVGSLEWSYGVFNQAQGRVWRLTSEKPVNIYVILHKDSIEEMLFDKLGQKEDVATICLLGKQVPRVVNTMHPDEIMAQHMTNFNRNSTSMDEVQFESDWPILRERFLQLEDSKDAINK
jgi:hypothetical protein